MTTPLPMPIRLGPSTLLVGVHLCVLLLLIVFACSPAITYEPLLPNAATGLPVGKDPATVGIDDRGRFFVFAPSGWERVADAEFEDRVRALARSRPGLSRLYVTADRDVSYGRLLVLAEAARRAGVPRLDLATNCPRGRESLLRSCMP